MAVVVVQSRRRSGETLVDNLASVLQCPREELYAKLHDSKIRDQAIAFLKLVRLETTHLNERNQRVKFSGLTYSGSRNLMAFRGFMQITVAQYYYARHKIILTYSDLPCVIHMPSGSRPAHVEYFPLELLRVVPPNGDE
jgi:hypothetical protein